MKPTVPLPQATTLTQYTIAPKNLAAHLFEVTVNIDAPDPAGQRFALPTWIPGSYMIREFARNIVSLVAMSGNEFVAVEKIDKTTWQCAPTKGNGELTLRYEVYAWDLSVRAAHLDENHGFFNGTSVFVLPEGRRDAPCVVSITGPTDWRIASALAEDEPPALAGIAGRNALKTPDQSQLSSTKTHLRYAANYDELIDHPVEMGTFTHASFDACGVKHHIAITGKHRADLPRLCADFKKICEAQIQFFEPLPMSVPASAQPATASAAPFNEYWFLLTVVGDGFGGLEHRASSALIAGRDDLPHSHVPGMTPGYRKLLSLTSHEYFHTWNVKRIKPAAFIEYDLFNESYTRQLWFFEGFTDYYDDLFLVRTGLITPLEYLEVEAENVGRVLSQSGRLKQSVAESSFDAWTKYYRQDENAPNAIVSYYQKGAMVALALDLMIRSLTENSPDGPKSLDDVMRFLWTHHGKGNIGVPENGIEKIVAVVTGLDLKAFFNEAVYGTNDLALAPLFAAVGIEMSARVPGQAKAGDTLPPTIGARVGIDTNGDAKLVQVFDGGAAQEAGLSAGDTIVAIDGLRVTANNFDRRIKSFAVATTVEMIAFRRDEIRRCMVTLQAQAASTVVLTTRDTAPECKLRRDRWLGQ